MPSKISRAVAAYTSIAICVITSNAQAAMVEPAKPRLSATAARPALFKLNTGQFASDIAYWASFPQQTIGEEQHSVNLASGELQ